MSQATDLLNSLSGDAVATYTANVEEEHIVIGTDRFIRIPDSLKRLGVQHDKDIETVTFDCPRYWDKHDLSQMVIYVNYVLPNGEDGKYPVKNVVAIGTTLHFDWTISDYVTQYKGTISFLICAVTTDAEGNEELHWNSELNQEAYISEGLECSESPIHKYPDIITRLLTRMDEVEAIATPEAMQTYTETWLEENHARILAEIEAKGKATLDTIPEDYTETHNMAKESVRTKGDAIVCSAQGEVIAVSDSSDDHIRGLRVFGKTTQVKTTGAQKLPYPFVQTTRTTNGITYTDNGDGSITITGTATAKAYMDLYNKPEIPGPHFLSGVPKNSGFKMYAYTGGAYKEETGNGVLLANGVTSVHIVVDEGATVDATIYPMLSEGESALPWEPYSAGVASPSPNWPQSLDNVNNTTVDICGGNLFNFNGITPTDSIVANPDGTITVNVYAAPTGKTLKQLAPSLKVGYRYKLTIDTESTNKFIYLLEVKRTWDRGATITMTDAILNSKVYVYGVNGDAPMIIRNIEIVPEGVAYTGASYVEPQHITVNHTLSGISSISDEIDFDRGVYIQRINRVALTGDETYGLLADSGGEMFVTLPTNAAYTNSEVTCLCNYYPAVARQDTYDNGTTPGFIGLAVSHGHARITDNVRFNGDSNALQAWVTQKAYEGSPLIIDYILATPIETPLSAEELEAFKALKTNHPSTTVFNDSGAHMELKYNADTKTYVDNGIKQTVTEVMEAIENGSY